MKRPAAKSDGDGEVDNSTKLCQGKPLVDLMDDDQSFIGHIEFTKVFTAKVLC